MNTAAASVFVSAFATAALAEGACSDAVNSLTEAPLDVKEFIDKSHSFIDRSRLLEDMRGKAVELHRDLVADAQEIDSSEVTHLGKTSSDYLDLVFEEKGMDLDSFREDFFAEWRYIRGALNDVPESRTASSKFCQYFTDSAQEPTDRINVIGEYARSMDIVMGMGFTDPADSLSKYPNFSLELRAYLDAPSPFSLDTNEVRADLTGLQPPPSL